MTDLVRLGERRSLGDRYGLGGAGLHAFARQAVGGSKSPRAAAITRMPNAERFAFGQRCQLRHFLWRFALADVHHAHIGVSGAAHLRGVDRPVSPVLHRDYSRNDC